MAKIIKAEVDSTVTRLAASGAGGQKIYTVPVGDRVTIYAVHCSRTAGDATLTSLRVEGLVDIFSQSAAGSLITLLLQFPIVLDEDMTLEVQVSTISTDTTWEVKLYYAEEDAF